MKRYFITGTDTDCGKTHATAALLAYWQKQGVRAIGFKPVASGCAVVQGQCISEDATALARYGAHAETDVWRFEPPISPHIAAALAGADVQASAIVAACEKAAPVNTDILLIEGAGGLMVPLNAEETWLDVLKLTGMPVILVVGMRLGCLNHALLTATVLQQQGVMCAGWIANWLDPEMLVSQENLQTLRAWMPFPLLADIPWQGEISFLHPKKFP